MLMGAEMRGKGLDSLKGGEPTRRNSLPPVRFAPAGSVFAPEQTLGQSAVGESAAAANALWSGGPSPFSRSTTVRFSQAARGPVSIAVFDVAGRRVRTLVDETLDAGDFALEWDGTSESGGQVPSGLYFVRMQAGGFSRNLRVSILR